MTFLPTNKFLVPYFNRCFICVLLQCSWREIIYYIYCDCCIYHPDLFYHQVRNSAVRTLFQTLGIHGQKLSKSMWEDCLWNYVFPTLDCVSHMVHQNGSRWDNSFPFLLTKTRFFLQAATSSKDEWQGKELGTRKGKAVHMLIHHRYTNICFSSLSINFSSLEITW